MQIDTKFAGAAGSLQNGFRPEGPRKKRFFIIHDCELDERAERNVAFIGRVDVTVETSLTAQNILSSGSADDMRQTFHLNT